MFVGRFPGNVRCGTSPGAVPSASTSAAVLPRASASVCAKKFAISRSWWSPSALCERQKPMKSHGISFVPWWMSW